MHLLLSPVHLRPLLSHLRSGLVFSGIAGSNGRADGLPAAFARADILRELPDAERSNLARRAQLMLFESGRLIFRPGNPGALYVVLQGRVAILTQPAPGREFVVLMRTAHDHDVIGEASLADGIQISTARAAEDTLAARLEVDSVRAALRGNVSARLAWERALVQRVATAEARLGEVSTRDVKDRLIHLLRRLTVHGTHEADGIRIDSDLTHEELADMVGASRVSVSRALATLRRNGAIVMRRGRIIVRRAS